MSKDLIVKGNKFIEARYRLSITEARLMLKMVSVIKKEDEDFKSYRFFVPELLDEFSMHSKDHKEIEKATAGLIGKVMRIEDAENNTELQISFMSSAKYYRKQGIVELKFDPELKPYLLQLQQNFTRFQLSIVKRLNSVYAIRIYELAKQYEKIGTRWFQLDKLKQILGIAKQQYQLYGHFKNRVLLPAQKEINQHTELSLNIREIKHGRRVESLEFHISSTISHGLNRLAKNKKAV